jgi:hypothetical protein
VPKFDVLIRDRDDQSRREEIVDVVRNLETHDTPTSSRSSTSGRSLSTAA